MCIIKVITQKRWYLFVLFKYVFLIDSGFICEECLSKDAKNLGSEPCGLFNYKESFFAFQQILSKKLWSDNKDMISWTLMDSVVINCSLNKYFHHIFSRDLGILPYLNCFRINGSLFCLILLRLVCLMQLYIVFPSLLKYCFR